MKFSSVCLFLASIGISNAANVAINATTSGINNPQPGGFQIITADLYTLNTYDNLEITKLQLVGGQVIDPSLVECRMYKDNKGLQPGSEPFSGSTVAYVSTNTVSVGSIACYGIGIISSTT